MYKQIAKKTIFHNLLIVMLCWSCGFKPYIIQTHFDLNNIPPKTNYALQTSWASLPTKIDPADSTPNNSRLKNNQEYAKADVFFIHPTIYTGKPTDNFTWNASTENKLLNNSLDYSSILHQASIFNESCKIYAPRYRQAHYYTFITKNSSDSDAALEIAYQDVKSAFEYYLENFNNNRPIIIASHSQGSYHGRKLIKEFFDDKPLQKKLVIAFLVGYPIQENSFEKIKPSKEALDVSTFVSWNSFADQYIPPYYTTFGLEKSVCNNPLSWKMDEKKINAEMNLGGMGPKFKIIPKAIDAKCNKGLLWVGKPNVKGGKLLKTKIWHNADYNFFYLNIRENVSNRINNYLKQNNSNNEQ